MPPILAELRLRANGLTQQCQMFSAHPFSFPAKTPGSLSSPQTQRACWEGATIPTPQKRCLDFADLDDMRKASLPSKSRRVGVKVSFPTTSAFCFPGKARTISNNPGETPEARQAKQRLGGLGVTERARIKGWGGGGEKPPYSKKLKQNQRFEILHS